jgi:hypothetical protein
MSFTVKLFVHPKAAILAGKSDFGIMDVTVTDQVLQDLYAPAREELAEIVTKGDVVGKSEGDLDASEASVDELLRLLAHRVVLRRQTATALRAAQEAERVETARQHEEAAVRRREDEAKAAKRLLAIQKWVADKGTASQKKRLAEGVLPVEEVLEAITSHLCEDLGIDSRERYTRITVDEACACACAEQVEFDVRPTTALTEDQHELLLEAREEAGTAVALTHRAKCPGCSCPVVERRSIQIEMQWHGIDVIREYLI